MRLRLATTGLVLVLLAAVAAGALESQPAKRAIPAAAAALRKDEVEGSGDPPKAGTADTDARKSTGYSPDDEDAVEGSGLPLAPTRGAPVAPAPVAPGQPPKTGPQAPAPPPPPPDSDDESVEGSGSDKDTGSVYQPPSLTTTTTTTTAAPAAVQPAVVPPAAVPVQPKTMWETVAVTESPVFTTRQPPIQAKTTEKSRERSTERTPIRPSDDTTEQPALFPPFNTMLKPGIFAAVVGGTVVGLLMAILLVMFIVYRMRKRDEGSYALEEPKQRPYAGYAYTKASSTKEFYA